MLSSNWYTKQWLQKRIKKVYINKRLIDHLDQLINVASHQPVKPLPCVNSPTLHISFNFLFEVSPSIFLWWVSPKLVDPPPTSVGWCQREFSIEARCLQTICPWFSWQRSNPNKSSPTKSRVSKKKCWDLWTTHGSVYMNVSDDFMIRCYDDFPY